MITNPIGVLALSKREIVRFLSVASHFLHSGFLRTIPRGLALAFG